MECAIGRDITLIYQYLDLGFLNLKLLLTMNFTVNGYLVGGTFTGHNGVAL
jgi:hypothetical protein